MEPLPRTAALVLIDLQCAIDDPRWGRRNNPDAEANAGRLLAGWRSTRRPIIHVQHLSTEPNSPYRPGQSGCDFKEAFIPAPGEMVIRKRTPSAFIGSELERRLTEQGIHALVVAGVITNNSVEATARHAGNLGFATWVVADATATVDKRDLSGRLWPAEDVHALSLANLQGEYATITDTATLLAALA